MGMLKLYADKACTKPIEIIEWNNKVIIPLITGENKKLINTAGAGEMATATVYLRNESQYPYAITNIFFGDKRITFNMDRGFLYRFEVVKLTVNFQVPEKVTPKDVIKSGKILIDGYYIYGV